MTVTEHTAQLAERDRLPSFSLILETENLATAKLEGLSLAIDSLSQQDLSPTEANEVWLLDSGDAPANLLNELCMRYPWLKLYRADAEIDYHEAKMLGATLATGEVVVYYDCDCIYEPTWLRTMLTPFVQSKAIQIVAGETITRGVGPYETAMNLTYIFPQYSGQNSLQPAKEYFLNNVAFRRGFLLSHPLPTDLPLYRGNCVIHAQQLRDEGHTIWRNPTARATHPAPAGLSMFIWRFLLVGHDFYWQNRLLRKQSRQTVKPKDLPYSGLDRQLQVLRDRIQKMIARDRRHLLFLPLAIPIAAVSVGLIFAGYVITAIDSDFLMRRFSACK